ncbi:MAG: S8 family serine peptidase [Saprospiraceae bacterium]|nr:S8 family serine peptidase [Saprospiraceae bacterium]
MKEVKFISFLFFICAVLNLTGQSKVTINKADDLPRRSVTLKGKALDIVDDLDQLEQLTNVLIENLEGDLAKYDIKDKATLRGYYFSLVSCYLFKKDLDKSLEFLSKARQLEDKESTRLTTGLFLHSFAKAYEQSTDIHSVAFKKTFKEAYAEAWGKLPYDKIKNELESQRGSLSIFNPNLITTSLESQIQPFLDNNNNVVPEGVVMSFIGIRLALDYRAALVPEMLAIINEIYEANKTSVTKKDIWSEREVSLASSNSAEPVVVAVWDSGTDTGVFPDKLVHKDKNGKSGIGYSLIDYQKDDLLLENPAGKIKSDLKRLQNLTKGFMDLQAAVESPEVAEVRKTMASLKPAEAEDFQEELSFYGNYAHGTHVAGIAMKGNPFARLLVVRMGFDYRTLPPAHTMENAKFQANMYQETVDYLKQNKVRVVNMSWRYGVASYEGSLALNGVGKDEEERKQMAREMFELEKQALYNAFKSAPEILFICGSGNENNDTDFDEYIPASFYHLPNLVTVGAVDSEGKKTSFTTEGKGVKLYANGFEVESYVPGGEKVRFSGTSMASPYVANLAAKVLAIQPNLSPAEVIALIEKGADQLSEDSDLLLINPKKTLELIDAKISQVLTRRQLLTGKWKPDAHTASLMVDDYLEEVKAYNAEQAKAMEGQKSSLVQMFAQIVVEYKKDGSAEISLPNTPTQIGTWELTENDKKISMQIAGQMDYETIESLDENELKTRSSKGNKYVYHAQKGSR